MVNKYKRWGAKKVNRGWQCRYIHIHVGRERKKEWKMKAPIGLLDSFTRFRLTSKKTRDNLITITSTTRPSPRKRPSQRKCKWNVQRPRVFGILYWPYILICTKLVIRRFLVFFLCMHLFIFCPGFITHLFYCFLRVRGDNKKSLLVCPARPCRNIEVERCFIAEKKVPISMS